MAVIWTLSDGKAGDALQCLGVAEAVNGLIGGQIVEHTICPRWFYALAMPYGLPDPRDLNRLQPPWPDLVIGSGRRAVVYLRWLKTVSRTTVTVFLKDPRTGTGAADFIWVPEHDRLRGANVLATLTSPHRLSPQVLAVGRRAARDELKALPEPRIAVLLGGPSRDVAFKASDIAAFSARLADLVQSGAGIMITPSRRTPQSLMLAVSAVLERGRGWIWDGHGPNPYVEMMGLADGVVVTADSTNMLSEAAATGKTIQVFVPEGVPARIMRFVDGLIAHGAVVNFKGSLENRSYEPLDSTPVIAREIVARFFSASHD